MPKNKNSRQKTRRRQVSDSAPQSSASASIKPLLAILVLSAVATGILIYAFRPNDAPVSRRERERNADAEQRENAANPRERTSADTRSFSRGNLTMVWDSLTPDVLSQIAATSKSTSNIRQADYAGPDACKSCHQENHADWSAHSHKWMNALATPETVRGNFEDGRIEYRGGEGRFFQENGQYRMTFDREQSLEHNAVHREYVISQTIGSRFYQYYVGRGVEGPEPEGHSYYSEDFVLPFGFWFAKQAWVPIVHVAEEKREGQRWESIESLKPLSLADGMEGVGIARGVIDHSSELGLVYAKSCNYCHTTFALGDMMVRNPKLLGPSFANPNVFEMSSFVSSTRPDRWDGQSPPEQLSSSAIQQMTNGYAEMDARQSAVSLGISCEACHLGCEEHVKEESRPPAFKPLSPHLHEFIGEENPAEGRSQMNTNSACARCHVGNRPIYAAGMATWNSVELTDAMRGGCYSELSCAHCHDPHKAIGQEWSRTAAQDDASCLSCHEKYEEPQIRLAHTHHPAGSSGDRCMNCHMPKINEGMQDVVRTHMIYSPTQPDMIESNHPNACNLCHLDQNIEWTINYLEAWYGGSVNRSKVAQNYSDASQPVGRGWINGEHEATRLVAAEAAAQADSKWLLPDIIQMLDDPYLLNRQFAQKSVEALTSTDLAEEHGYWYYKTKSERKELLDRIRESLLNNSVQ